MRSRFALVVIVVLACSTAAAQATWDSHTRTGEYAFAIGETERAEQEFRAALEIAQRLPPPDRRLELSLANLAKLYEHGQRFTEALPMYQLQAAAIQARLGDDSSELLAPLLGVARTAIPTGDVPAAEDALRRYRDIAAAGGAADPDDTWIALALLARTLTLQNQPEEALQMQREAVAVLEEAHRPTEFERAAAVESLAQMELKHGTPDAAEALLVRAAELRAADVEGGSIAEMLTAAAGTAYTAGEFEVAERLGQQALAAAEEEGRDTASVERVLADVAWMRVQRGTDNLGDLYLARSPRPELDQAYERLLEIHGAVDADTSPAAIRENLTRLAQVAALRGEVDDCAHWQRMVVDLERKETGATSQQTLAAQENLIGLFMAAERSDRAVTANAWLITAQEKAWGENSPRLAPALERQLELLTEAGLKKEAKAVKKRLKKL